MSHRLGAPSMPLDGDDKSAERAARPLPEGRVSSFPVVSTGESRRFHSLTRASARGARLPASRGARLPGAPRFGFETWDFRLCTLWAWILRDLRESGLMMGGKTMGGETMGGKLRKQHSMPCQAPFEPPEIAELLSCVVPARPIRTQSYGKHYFVRLFFACYALRFAGSIRVLFALPYILVRIDIPVQNVPRETSVSYTHLTLPTKA